MTIDEIKAHYPGKDCNCIALDTGDCGCGADWRNRDTLILNWVIEQLSDPLPNPYETLRGIKEMRK